jgi:hypothetical protein
MASGPQPSYPANLEPHPVFRFVGLKKKGRPKEVAFVFLRTLDRAMAQPHRRLPLWTTAEALDRHLGILIHSASTGQGNEAIRAQSTYTQRRHIWAVAGGGPPMQASPCSVKQPSKPKSKP